ncbi:hypothetical protein TWF718_004598 [Orbilia javanica]|uniref:Uncharacterized protein n=1 Tax=Orbilia javanica TaxID=47235 RepID=A0AAN8MSG7_9PEZI
MYMSETQSSREAGELHTAATPKRPAVKPKDTTTKRRISHILLATMAALTGALVGYYVLTTFCSSLMVIPTFGYGQITTNTATLVARGSEGTGNPGRYAYQSVRQSQSGKPKKPDQVVPLVELVDNGKTVTARVSHSHPNPVPLMVPRDVEPEASETTEDLEDGPSDAGSTKEPRAATDIVHTDLSTRMVAYSTDPASTITYYRLSRVEIYHTHSRGTTPIAPNINPEMAAENEDRDVEHENTNFAQMTASSSQGSQSDMVSSTASPGQVNAAGEIQSEETGLIPTISPVAKGAPLAVGSHDFSTDHKSGKINVAYNSSHGDSSYTHNHTHFSVGHDDGDGDVTSLNDTIVTRTARSAQVMRSIIADSFFNINRTVTHVSGSTWRQVTTTAPPAPSMPTNRVIGPIETVFEPATNITYEVIPMELDDPEDPYTIFWNPVSTGTPTRADHLSLASSWKANGGKYPSVPTRYDIVWDHRTNTTWNKTIEGTWDNWVEVYVSITTQYPAPPKTPVPAIPTRPGQASYDPITNPNFTWGPGPNWVGPSSGSSSSGLQVSKSASPENSMTPSTFSDSPVTTISTPTDGATLEQAPTNPRKSEVDKHYPVPFFPEGPEKYEVWSEWIGYCGVIKHIIAKGELRTPLKPFGDFQGLGGKYITNMCLNGLDYYIHIDNESNAGRYWAANLMQDRNVAEDGYAATIPGWTGSYINIEKATQDLITPEWIADCLVILHHAGTSTWRNDFLDRARKDFDPHGRRYISVHQDLVQSPKNCPKIEMLLHVEEYHGLNGFLLGDWWITPLDSEPFYLSVKDAAAAPAA